MSNLGQRLKKARLRLRLTQADLGRLLGITRNAVALWEAGTNAPTMDRIEAIAENLNVSAEYLLTGTGNAPTEEVAVVAFVGAGAEINPMDDHAKGTGLKRVAPPPGVTDCVAAIIRGDSMLPLRDGWLIFWNRDYHGVTEDCIGKLCVAQILDGPCLVKEVHKGSNPGLYILTSWNAPARMDVRLEWAAPVLNIRPT